jgi:hypothetical protein
MKSFFFKEMFKKPDYFRDTILQLKELHNDHLSDQVIHSSRSKSGTTMEEQAFLRWLFGNQFMKKDFRRGYFIRNFEIV